MEFNKPFICEICVAETSVSAIFSLRDCQHSFCRHCLITYISISISESRIDPICPMPNCCKNLHPNDIENLLSAQMLIKWESYQIRRALLPEPNARWCPAPTCPYALVAVDYHNCPQIVCAHPGMSPVKFLKETPLNHVLFHRLRDRVLLLLSNSLA